MQLQGIGLENLKVFKERYWFDFRNITLLTGTNNSGKSSLINTMQMLQENIQVDNIDELVRTKFKVTANQNKYGSVSTFVNNKSKEKDDYFIFVRRLGNIEYYVKIQVFKGIESYGMVQKIVASDLRTKTMLYALEIDNALQTPVFRLNINFKYFVDRFYEKCKNTEILFNRLMELDKAIDLVNEGLLKKRDVYTLADTIAREVSVYVTIIDIYNETGDKIDLAYSIDKKPRLDVGQNQKMEEIKVLFTEKADKSELFISKEEYEILYAKANREGIFDFSEIWGDNSSQKDEFENSLCCHYNKDKNASYKSFNDDLLTELTNTIWTFKERASWRKIIEKFIDSIPDFGYIAKLVKLVNPEDGTSFDYIGNRFILLTSKFILNESIKKLFQKEYIQLTSKMDTIIFNQYNKGIEYRERIVSEAVSNHILAEIKLKLINIDFRLNNTYVSSSRYITTRVYNFKDNSDFTNFLKLVEESTENNYIEELKFINEWIKRFNIADELVLKPDYESGNFKAYLRKSEKEILLADFGLGTNQLLPIIFALSIHSKYDEDIEHKFNPRTVLIEEPEANLHPALQSLLADLFLDANQRFNVQIIVETHSEYLIRKLQYLVAESKNSLKSDDVIIYYFYKPQHPAVINGEVNQVERIEIDKYGLLSKEFGSGFFDESINWSFETMKLRNLN